jgi:hypothetical protein
MTVGGPGGPFGPPPDGGALDGGAGGVVGGGVGGGVVGGAGVVAGGAVVGPPPPGVGLVAGLVGGAGVGLAVGLVLGLLGAVGVVAGLTADPFFVVVPLRLPAPVLDELPSEVLRASVAALVVPAREACNGVKTAAGVVEGATT